MEIANCWLKIDHTGSNVQLERITPAEAAILNENHEANARGVAVHDVVVVGNEERTGEAEINRLKAKYPNAKDQKGTMLAEKLYPGKNPILPQKFSEVGLTPLKAEKPPEEPKKSDAPKPANVGGPAPALTATPANTVVK